MFEQISGLAESTFQSALVYTNMLTAAAQNLRSFAKLAKDSPVTSEHEQAKRDAISRWLSTADAIDIAVDMIERGPTDAKLMAQELFNIMSVRSYEFHGADKSSEIEDLLRDRANNIAQVYVGRIAREPA